MKPIALLSILAVALTTGGCMNLIVPKTTIAGEINGKPFMLSSPKDSKLNGLEIVSWNLGAFSNHVSIKIQSVEAKMNPEVITTTAEGQTALIQAVGAEVRSGLAAAAGAAK